MNAIEIIAKIRQAGGSITSDGTKISVSIPPGMITAEDQAVLVENRETLISILAPADHPATDEREAIVFADTPEADEALDQACREWGEIVSPGPTANDWDGWPESVFDVDLEYLIGPRVYDPLNVEQIVRRGDWESKRYPGPCPFCGGRNAHSEPCKALRLSWEPTMPWGQFRGVRVSSVPTRYIEWLATRKGLPAELREAIAGATP